MNFGRQILVIGWLMMFAVSVSGISLYNHFCHGVLHEVSLNQDAACSADEPEHGCCNTTTKHSVDLAHYSTKSGCCDNSTTLLKGVDLLWVNGSQEMDIHLPVLYDFVALSVDQRQVTSRSPVKSNYYNVSAPPDLQVAYQVFRL